MEQAFGGSALRLVQAALSQEQATAEEMAAIRRLLHRSEGGEP